MESDEGTDRFRRAFLIQVAGAAMASGNNVPNSQVLRGKLTPLQKTFIDFPDLQQ